MDSSADNRFTLALRRGVVAVLGALRRVLGGIYQVAFRDRLADIDEKTDRLGSASVESVTYLGGEVRALDQRLDRIERELAALRELLEKDGGGRDEAAEADQVRAGSSGGQPAG